MSALVRQHLSSAAGTQDGKAGGGGGVRGRIAVEFYEKKRRRSGMWFGGLAGKGEEEVCWEIWTLDVTIATPRTESGKLVWLSGLYFLVIPRMSRDGLIKLLSYRVFLLFSLSFTTVYSVIISRVSAYAESARLEIRLFYSLPGRLPSYIQQILTK